MTKMKKILAVALCVLLLGSVFAGCSGKKAEQTTEITDETLLIAYTADNAPFFQIDEKGNASGFEADLIAKIFDSIKDDCKNYAYVKVEPGYRLGEETAYTDKDAKTYCLHGRRRTAKERRHQQRGLQFHQHGHQQPSGDLGKERQ